MNIDKRPQILAISGSIRVASTNMYILEYLKNKYSDRLDIRIFGGLAELPHFNPEMSDGGTPQAA